MPVQTNFRQKAYEHVRSKLLAGEMRAGDRLSEVALAREIGISRTPVREALNQLASEGLLERDALGVSVTQITRKELMEMARLRHLLEAHAARRAAKRMTDRELEELRLVVDRLRDISRKIRDAGMDSWRGPLGHQLAMTDVLFHLLILQAADSPRTLKIVTDFRLMTMRHTRPSLENITNLSRTLGEHWRIYRALRRRDPRAAASAMSAHKRSYRRKLAENYDREQRDADDRLTTRDWSAVLDSLSRRTGLNLGNMKEQITGAASKRRLKPRQPRRRP